MYNLKLIVFFMILYYNNKVIKSLKFFSDGFWLFFISKKKYINVFIKEIEYNKDNKIFNCCNPYCKIPINNIFYYGYNAYYCSKTCRTFSGKMQKNQTLTLDFNEGTINTHIL